MTHSNIRLAVIAPIALPNLGALFTHLSQSPGISLDVYYVSGIGTEEHDDRHFPGFDAPLSWGVDSLAGYRNHPLWRGADPDPNRWTTMRGSRLTHVLKPDRVDVAVIVGWQYPANLLAVALCRVRGIPYLMYGDTDVRGVGRTRPRWLRRLALEVICQGSVGALYLGTFNRDFYIRHGVDPENCWFTPWAVDNAHFSPRPRAAARAELELDPDTTYFVSVGQLVRRKRVDLLISAIRALSAEGHRVGALICGMGPLEAELAASARADKLDVRFLGFVDQNALPNVYSAADAFVLCSEADPRAAVVNEAMACALPVVVTRAAGMWGPGDILRHGREGYVVDVSSIHALADALRSLLDPSTRRHMGESSRRQASIWSVENAVSGWEKAIRYAVGEPSAPSGNHGAPLGDDP